MSAEITYGRERTGGAPYRCAGIAYGRDEPGGGIASRRDGMGAGARYGTGGGGG